ncbi:MAG: PD-(D/E)XK nuclease family protein [Patescibacteria group bacterium]
MSPPPSPFELLGNAIHSNIVLAAKQEKPLSEIISDFLKPWLNRDDIDPLERSRLANYGQNAMQNFYQRYFDKQELINTISLEKDVATCFSWDGQLALNWQSKRPPGYQLFGRVDEIHRLEKTLVIRDFKLKVSKLINEETDFSQKLQLGIYRSCLEPHLEKYNCEEIVCEIFDLTNNRIIPIEPFSTGEIHAIVKKTRFRIKGRSQSRNLELCPTCPYKQVCSDPYHSPPEWIKTKEAPSQLGLSFTT